MFVIAVRKPSSLIFGLSQPFSASTSPHKLPDKRTLRNIPYATQRAIVALLWWRRLEHLYLKNFGNRKLLLSPRVFYTWHGTNSPTYKSVCSRKSGHAASLL